jgi:hypothetical protein
MKIELVQEYRIAEGPWYSVYVDGRYIIGSFDREKAERYYIDAKNNYGNMNTKIILKSEELGVSSQTN